MTQFVSKPWETSQDHDFKTRKISTLCGIVQTNKFPLSCLTKVYLKLLVKRLQFIIDHNNLLQSQQFGSRAKQTRNEEIHIGVNQISEDLGNKCYSSTAFYDFSQAFDNLWDESVKA